jgi:hypothetical protein
MAPLIPALAMLAGEAEVDLARAAAERDLDGRLELSRDAVRANEVPAGPARDDRQLRLQAGDPVRHLVHGPVAADGHDQLCATLGGEARELGELPRPFRQERVAS